MDIKVEPNIQKQDFDFVVLRKCYSLHRLCREQAVKK